MPCSFVEIYWLFGTTYKTIRRHIQKDEIFLRYDLFFNLSHCVEYNSYRRKEPDTGCPNFDAMNMHVKLIFVD
jgi:hypothetical protein